MGRLTKRQREIAKIVEENKSYTVLDAIDILKKCPALKFDQSVEVSLKLSADPRKADQQVRGTVSLPNGTGKSIAVLVFAKGDKVQEALDAGADYAGSDELLAKVSEGWTDFDAVVATPDMMREVGKLGKVLGPRGLMPTPKAGTVTTEVGKVIKDLKGGMIEYKIDKHSCIHNAVGKLSFSLDALKENISVYLSAIVKAKPAAAKGNFLQSIFLSSTMGPGLKIDARDIESS